MSLYGRLFEDVGEELRTKINTVLHGRDHKVAHELAKWFASKFRFKAGRTPRGGKEIKKKAETLWWFLNSSWMGGMHGQEITQDHWNSIGLNWKQKIEPDLDKLVKLFTDEGGTKVPAEIKVGKRIYRNAQGFTEKKLRGLIAKLEPIWKQVKGWRAHAFDGDLVVVLQSPKMFRGTVKGTYKGQLDELWVRATPKVMKQLGSYGAFDYVLLHELGHRFERRSKAHLAPVDFEHSSWHTTKYSQSSGSWHSEAFAELFALGIRGWPRTNWASSEVDGKAVVAKFEKTMAGKKAVIEGNMSLYQRIIERVDVAGVYVQNVKTGKKLILKRKDGRWDITKGGVDKGEEPRQAAKRETGEESGIVPKVGDEFVDVTNKKNKRKLRIFTGTTKKTKVKLMPSEHTKAKWVDDDEAIEKLQKTPHLAKAVAKLRSMG